MANFIPKVRVSRSKSGFNVYVPTAAVEPLKGHRVGCEIRKRQEGGYVVTLIPQCGVNRFTEHGNPSIPYRISFRDLIATGIPLAEMPNFGTFDVEWNHATNLRAGNGSSVTGLSFHLPEVEKLPAPMKMKVRTPKGNGKLAVPLDKQPETPHAALGRVMREFNDLCDAHDFSDTCVTLNCNGEEFRVTVAKGTRLAGKRTRVEDLG